MGAGAAFELFTLFLQLQLKCLIPHKYQQDPPPPSMDGGVGFYGDLSAMQPLRAAPGSDRRSGSSEQPSHRPGFQQNSTFHKRLTDWKPGFVLKEI